MERVKASSFILNLLKELSIQQIEALSNIRNGKNYAEYLAVFNYLISSLRDDVYSLDNTDPHLGVKKASLTGRGDGIIIIKQLLDHSGAELNRRMTEK